MQDLCSQPGWNLCHLQGKCRFSNHWTTREVPQFMSAKAETLVLWPPYAKSWLIGQDSDAGRDWGARGEGDDRGWDGWMASLTRRTWVWVDSGSWWWTGRPGVLRFIGSQRVGHEWVTELNWTESLQMMTEAMKLKDACFLEVKLWST